ncbi:MAG: ABC transporter ATP-binding protein [Candidatus Thermoplasmatota archaeon]|nr:ABC transporter ATP-binding protein [Candidatus Thermoplasmatota archaeon]MCL5963092.1 ABC transporter ATP-binding protein [Candidatus Thermoplasmatota archaeon]
MHIEVKKISKIYENNKYALKGISLDIDANGVFSIIGKNGAGKTTLVRILATQLMPTSGYAKINGYDLLTESKKIRRFIAAVPQEARTIPWLTPIQTVLSYLMWRGYSYSEAKEKAKDSLRMLNLEDIENKKTRKLSGGQKRKVIVATILASDATLIFLDEPTTGLDYLSRKELWNLLYTMKKDRLIILTTHYLEEAENLGDTICILNKGRVVDMGTILELRKKIKYSYCMKVFSNDFKISNLDGYIKRVSSNEIQIFTSGKYVYDIANRLISEKIRFTFQEVSLTNIFEFLLEDDIDVQ